VITLPQPMVVFPFIALGRPAIRSPAGLATSEVTGGLLPVAPIVVFLVALPWIWRRRPALLGGLAAPLMILAGAGVAMMLLAAYEYFASTERYEVDFATLLILGGLAAWLSLSKGPPGHRRLLLRAGGGLLVAWGCAVGLASSFFGYGGRHRLAALHGDRGHRWAPAPRCQLPEHRHRHAGISAGAGTAGSGHSRIAGDAHGCAGRHGRSEARDSIQIGR
jgi:hypothetical protein